MLQRLFCDLQTGFIEDLPNLSITGIKQQQWQSKVKVMLDLNGIYLLKDWSDVSQWLPAFAIFRCVDIFSCL